MLDRWRRGVRTSTRSGYFLRLHFNYILGSDSPPHGEDAVHTAPAAQRWFGSRAGLSDMRNFTVKLRRLAEF